MVTGTCQVSQYARTTKSAAALEAFWGMDRRSMDKRAKHLEINIPHGSSLLTTIPSLTQGVFKDKSE